MQININTLGQKAGDYKFFWGYGTVGLCFVSFCQVGDLFIQKRGKGSLLFFSRA